MDPAIEEAAKRQSGLEAAKAAFFTSGGQAQLIPTGVGKDSPGVEQAPKPAYGYRSIEAQKSKRGRIISAEDKVALAKQLIECKAAGMTRYKASKYLDISETLCRRLIADYSLDFPASA